MAFESIHLLYEEMGIIELNGTPITRVNIDDFLTTYTDWGMSYDEECKPFIFTDASTTQSITFSNPTGGGNITFNSQPFVGGKPRVRPGGKWY